MDAHIWMTGRVGSDVDYKTINNTFAVASFRMACTPRMQRGGEWVDDHTTWVTVRCAWALSEGVKCSLSKGDPIVVVGKLRTNVWTDADGVVHEQLRLEATTVGHDLSFGTTAFRRLRRFTADAASTADPAGGLIGEAVPDEEDEAGDAPPDEDDAAPDEAAA